MFYEKNKKIFYFFPSTPPVSRERRPTRHHGVIMRGERAKDTLVFPIPRFRSRSRRARETARRRRGRIREERAKSEERAKAARSSFRRPGGHVSEEICFACGAPHARGGRAARLLIYLYI